MPIELSRTALKELSETAAIPAYDPAVLSAGIVHFGVGNFHRSHQAVYLDDLFNLGLDQDWAIVGAGVRPSDDAMRSKLEAQDWLTTVVEQEATTSSARITASMIDHLKIGDSAGIIAKLADPAIRIVAMTITEGGYFIDPATQKFDPTHPAIVSDAQNPDDPKTVFGLILAGLKARRAAGVQPFTVMSCDNIPGNGHVTERTIIGLAKLFDAELAEWVYATVAFPNGMVDRITPATTDRERDLLGEDFGIADNWPVFCESFKQWVLEDNFPAGRPALEKVGVQFVDDVAPFEHMKIRILNGGHAALAYPAALLDIEFVHQAMQNDLVRGFLEKLERTEIIPVVPPVPGIDLGGYFQLIDRRFSNPKIADTITRLCFDGSNRQPKFILPSAQDRLAQGQSAKGLAFVSALWARYCYGTTDSGGVVPPNDSNWARLNDVAQQAKVRPEAWLKMTDIYGALGENPAFSTAFALALNALWSKGTAATLRAYIGGTPF